MFRSLGSVVCVVVMSGICLRLRRWVAALLRCRTMDGTACCCRIREPTDAEQIEAMRGKRSRLSFRRSTRERQAASSDAILRYGPMPMPRRSNHKTPAISIQSATRRGRLSNMFANERSGRLRPPRRPQAETALANAERLKAL